MAIEPEVRIVCRAARRRHGAARVDRVSRTRSVEFSRRSRRSSAGEPTWANYSKGVAAELIGGGHPAGRHGRADRQHAARRRRAVEQRRDRGRHRPRRCSTLAGLRDGPASGSRCSARRPSTSTPACRSASWTRRSSPAARPATRCCSTAATCRSSSSRSTPSDAARGHRQQHGQARADRRRIRRAAPAVRGGRGVTSRSQTRRSRALRDVTMPQVEAAEGKLDDVVFRRCRHVVSRERPHDRGRRPLARTGRTRGSAS